MNFDILSKAIKGYQGKKKTSARQHFGNQDEHGYR
jgi:hypothetical protein